MEPRSLSVALRRIAAAIDNSRNPSRELVAQDLSGLISRLSVLKEFTIDPRNEWRDCWGGGHTTSTDPTKQGWKCLPVTGREKLAIIGQNGVAGCASVRAYPDIYDVAFYDETPKEVLDSLRAGKSLDAQYKMYEKTPGWGLPIIDEIIKNRV